MPLWRVVVHCYFTFFTVTPQKCKADIRNPLRYLLMNAVALRSVSGSFQLPLTEASRSFVFFMVIILPNPFQIIQPINVPAVFVTTSSN